MSDLKLRDWVSITNTTSPLNGKEGINLGQSGMAVQNAAGEQDQLYIIQLFEPLEHQLAVLIPLSGLIKIGVNQPYEPVDK